MVGSSTATIVAFNWVGTDRSGTEGIGNGTPGIYVASSGNQIGPGNVVTDNGSTATGVYIESGSGNRIVANSIFGNTGLGISLNEGANNNLSPASLTGAELSAGTTEVSGEVNSTPGKTYFVEVFSNTACDDDAPNGEGAAFAGFGTVVATEEFQDFSIPIGGLDFGDVVTATVTDAGTSDTSVFSNCVTVEAGGGGGGSLSGTLTPPSGGVSLTAEGTADWAVWGFSGGGGEQCNTPGACSTLARAGHPQDGRQRDQRPRQRRPCAFRPLRGIGFVPPQPVHVRVDGRLADSVGDERARPASSTTVSRRRTSAPSVRASASASRPTRRRGRSRSGSRSTARRASSPRRSRTDRRRRSRTRSTSGVGDFVGGVYTLTYSAASAGQTLTVSWIENVDNCAAFRCDNVSIHAVAPPGPWRGGGDADPPVLFGAVPNATAQRSASRASGTAGSRRPASSSTSTSTRASSCTDAAMTTFARHPRRARDERRRHRRLRASTASPNVPRRHARRDRERRRRLRPARTASSPTATTPRGRPRIRSRRTAPTPGTSARSGQARWFKVPILPNSRVDVHALEPAGRLRPRRLQRHPGRSTTSSSAARPGRRRAEPGDRRPRTRTARRRRSTSSTPRSTTRPRGIRRTGSPI